MTLRDRQRQLQRAILDDRQADLPGLAVYRNAYRLRLADALAVDYPMLRRWLGREDFARLARAYLAAHPSRHFSIRWIGRQLPAFLRRRGEMARADFADFEWHLGLAFDCADAEPLMPGTLAAIPPPDWPKLRFRFHPSVRLLWQRHAVLPLWRALQAGAPPPPCVPTESPVPVLVWRRGLRQFFRSLAPAEAEVLARLQRGGDFAGACDWLVTHTPTADAARQMALWLRQWLEAGLIAGLI